MKKTVVGWADRFLIDGWRDATRLWSVRAELAIGLVSIVVTILTLMSDAAQSWLGPWKFAAIFVAASVLKLVARLVRQSPQQTEGDDE